MARKIDASPIVISLPPCSARPLTLKIVVSAQYLSRKHSVSGPNVQPSPLSNSPGATIIRPREFEGNAFAAAMLFVMITFCLFSEARYLASTKAVDPAPRNNTSPSSINFEAALAIGCFVASIESRRSLQDGSIPTGFIIAPPKCRRTMPFSCKKSKSRRIVSAETSSSRANSGIRVDWPTEIARRIRSLLSSGRSFFNFDSLELDR